MDRPRPAQAAVEVAGEATGLGRDRKRPGIVEARAVPRPDRLQRHAPEAAKEADHAALVGGVEAFLVRVRTVPDLQAVGFATLAAPEDAELPRRRAVLVVDAED